MYTSILAQLLSAAGEKRIVLNPTFMIIEFELEASVLFSGNFQKSQRLAAFCT